MIVSHERRRELLEHLRASGPSSEDQLVERLGWARTVVHSALILLEFDRQAVSAVVLLKTMGVGRSGHLGRHETRWRVA